MNPDELARYVARTERLNDAGRLAVAIALLEDTSYSTGSQLLPKSDEECIRADVQSALDYLRRAAWLNDKVSETV